MSESIKYLENEPTGMGIYEYIVNHVETCREELPELTELMKSVDTNGQFLASTARFLCAVDRERYADFLTPLIEAAILKDRERKYIGSLLESIWGADYKDKVKELNATDNNFRRIYKRIFDNGM